MKKTTIDLDDNQFNMLNKASSKLDKSKSKIISELVEKFNKEQWYLLPSEKTCKDCLSFHLFCYQIANEDSEVCLCRVNSFKCKK